MRQHFQIKHYDLNFTLRLKLYHGNFLKIEDSGLLIKGVTEIVENEVYEQNGGF